VISPEVDMVYCLNIRFGPVFAVADAYVNWYDLNDEEVKQYLSKAWKKS
jgi:predicted phosphoribosyltransferase